MNPVWPLRSSSDVDVSIVAPAYNEEEILPAFLERVSIVMKTVGLPYELIIVDDGSTDNTFLVLRQAFENDPRHLRVLRLSRNFGHQIAITAGLQAARGRAVVVMDCDLQDPPDLIPTFIAEWQQGYEVVYGVRSERKGETWFKKATAALFYKWMRWATSVDIPENVGDFYLLDRKVVDCLKAMGERHRFLRGLVAWTGFRRVGVPYVREARTSGKTKFTFWKMLRFSLDAATSFSFWPLRLISAVGTVISFLAFVGIIVSIYLRLMTDYTITGWTSLMVVVLFMGGIQLLAIGLIGEYIARIGDDVKARPLFAVAEELSS